MKVYKVQMGDGRYEVKGGIKTFHVAAYSAIEAAELAGALWVTSSPQSIGDAEYPLNHMRIDEESPIDLISKRREE